MISSLNTACKLGESPIYHAKENCAYWLDLDDRFIYQYDLSKKAITKQRLKLKAPLGCLFLTSKGNFIITSNSGVHLYNFKKKKLDFLFDLRLKNQSLVYNDGISTRSSLFIGLSDRNEKKPIGLFYQLKNNSLEITAQNFPVANGPSLYKDQIIYSNSFYKRLEIYSKKQQKLLKTVSIKSGFPDGSCFDQQGGLWLAHWGAGKITRFHPSMKKDFSINLPSKNITSLCFIGDKKNTLLVTSASVDNTKKDLKSYPQPGNTFLIETKFKGHTIQHFDEKNLKMWR